MSNGSIWILYILGSQVSGKLYTGITNNLKQRLIAHNNGTRAKFTRADRLWYIVYQETIDGKSSTLRREIAIKKLSRSRKLTLILTQKQDLPSPLHRQALDELGEPPEL